MTDFDRREYDWRRWLGGGGSGKKLLSPYVSAALMLSKSMVNMQFDNLHFALFWPYFHCAYVETADYELLVNISHIDIRFFDPAFLIGPT